MIRIEWLQGNKDLSQVFKIRFNVFVNELDFPEEVEVDEFDRDGEHILVYQNGEPIATGRFYKEDGTYKLGRIAVLHQHRGKRLGELAVVKLLERAFKKGAPEVHIHAKQNAEAFYKKIGFTSYGDEYYQEGVKHINMKIEEKDLQESKLARK